MPLPANVRAVITGATRLRIIFSEEMRLNADLLDPASYAVATLNGSAIPVLTVTPEQPGAPRSVLLALGVALDADQLYHVVLNPALLTSGGMGVTPLDVAFTWAGSTGAATVALRDFSGEAHGGLLDNHAGLVFFSPALLAPLAGSVIEVEEVSCCTKAYDTYTFPVLIDPPSLLCNDPATVLGDAVLWAGLGRTVEAVWELRRVEPDDVTLVEDGRCVVTLAEPFDANYVSYLNNPGWHLYDGSGRMFICADISGPIPPGPTVVITLVPLCRRGYEDRMKLKEHLPAPHEVGLDVYLKSKAEDRFGGQPETEGRLLRGDVFLYLRDGKTGELQDVRELRNLVVKDASILVARLLKDNQEPPHGIFALAVGTGDTGWNLLAPPAPTVTQRSLYAEIARKTIGVTTYIDALGLPTATPTNVVDYETTFAEAEAVGPLMEMGLIGGNVNSNLAIRNPVLPPNGPYNPAVDLTTKDTLVNYLPFAVISKPATSTLTIVWRLTS